MRAAESAARAAKLRVWKGYAKPNLGNIDADFEGVVVEVVSGDQVVVLSSSGTEARVSLSSIKAPRLGNAKQSRKEEPWSLESKEALRHACIGKRCRVLVEYVREIPVGNADEGKTMKLVFARVCTLPASPREASAPACRALPANSEAFLGSPHGSAYIQNPILDSELEGSLSRPPEFWKMETNL